MSTKCGCTSPGSYATCAGFKVFNDSVTNANIASYYAQKVGAPFGKSNDTTCAPYSLVVDVILSHRLPYYKDSPGDCGKDTKVDISGASAGKALSITGTAGGTISTLGSFGALGITGTISTVASIATFGAGLALIPIAMIEHHSAEVALEQKVLCAVASGYNDFADQVETMLQNGQITLAQANSMADQMQQQIVSALSQGLKTCNARCYYTYAIKALTMFCKEKLYPSLVPQAQTTAAIPTATVSKAITSGTMTAIAVAGLLLAKRLFF